MIKEKGPVHNLFVKVSEDLDLGAGDKPLNSSRLWNPPSRCVVLSLILLCRYDRL
jgi:hypothetical protein